jgi:hypothetical protein
MDCLVEMSIECRVTRMIFRLATARRATVAYLPLVLRWNQVSYELHVSAFEILRCVVADCSFRRKGRSEIRRDMTIWAGRAEELTDNSFGMLGLVSVSWYHSSYLTLLDDKYKLG